MEDDNLTWEERQVEDEGLKNAGNRAAWLRCHLKDSVYLWACGEKANVDGGEDDPKLSDKFIGWFILLLQGFAYGMLIVLARASSDADTDNSAQDDGSSERSQYVLTSVTGAMYLLVASTSHDLQAGFSLLVDGSCAGHRALGMGLIIVYGSMISAAMTVLVSTSADSASVMLNAVAVLFIADLDEKALKFLSTVPQKWRLFWAIESIGISFSLALIAIYSVGNAFQLLQGNYGFFEGYPSCIVWVLNPAAVTMCAYRLSASLQGWFASCSAAFEKVDQLTFRSVVATAFVGLLAAIKRAKCCFRTEPFFYVALGVWLAQGAYSWWYLFHTFGSPIAFDLCLGSADVVNICMTEDGKSFVFVNAMIVVGIVMKTLGVLASLNHVEPVTAMQDPCRSPADGIETTNALGSCCAADSRMPSLLVGWGIGYWVTSLLGVFAVAWPDGGWSEAPTVVTVLGYVFVPCFTLATVFMVADRNVLGTKFGAYIKPAVDVLTDTRRVVYWVMASVLRDALFLWMLSITLMVKHF